MLDERHKILCMLLLKPLDFPGLPKLDAGVLSYRLQHAETRFRIACHFYHQVLAHQVVKYRDQLALPDALVNTHALRCPKRPRPGKDSEPAEEGCFILA